MNPSFLAICIALIPLSNFSQKRFNPAAPFAMDWGVPAVEPLINPNPYYTSDLLRDLSLKTINVYSNFQTDNPIEEWIIDQKGRVVKVHFKEFEGEKNQTFIHSFDGKGGIHYTQHFANEELQNMTEFIDVVEDSRRRSQAYIRYGKKMSIKELRIFDPYSTENGNTVKTFKRNKLYSTAVCNNDQYRIFNSKGKLKGVIDQEIENFNAKSEFKSNLMFEKERDSAGYRILTRRKEWQDGVVRTSIIKYNLAKEVEEIRVYKNNKIQTYESYHDTEKVIKKYNNGKLHKSWCYELNKEGNCTKESIYFKGKLVKNIYYTYNTEETLTSLKETNSKGKLTKSLIYKYTYHPKDIGLN